MPRARTVLHKDYPVDPTYQGLQRALEGEFEARISLTLKLADSQKQGNGTYYRLSFAKGSLDGRPCPVSEGWIVEPTTNSPRAEVITVDPDRDSLIVSCPSPNVSYRFASQLTLSPPDFQRKLRAWAQERTGAQPSLLQALQFLASPIDPDQLSPWLQGRLRHSQRLAVANSTPGSWHLWGPPGTGKTYTLAHTVLDLVERDFKVALLAPTNIAVDTAVLAVREAYIQHDSPMAGGFLVRAGYPIKLDEYPELMTWQEALKTSQTQLQKIAVALRENKAQLEASKGRDREIFLLRQAELKDEEREVANSRADQLWRLAKEARIMATTVHLAQTREEMTAFFAHPKIALIVDEAAMVPRYGLHPLLELLGGGQGLQNGLLPSPPEQIVLILAGDPRQLAPIYRQVNPKDVNARYWLGQSLMEELLEKPMDQPAPNHVVLKEQSRMDLSIGRRISKAYYHDLLITLPCSSRPRPPLARGWPDDGVVLLDAGKHPLPDNAEPESYLEKRNKSNERHIWVGYGLIQHALDCGRAKSVLWLSPFREQAALATTFCSAYFSLHNVRAGTIHTAQGSEADLVILDPVSLNHRWLRGQMGPHLDIERLLNVAVSRARGQVIVFATRRQLRKNGIFNKLLYDATEWGGQG